jgi:RimJ/RimL family protein N-acetyltransferase
MTDHTERAESILKVVLAWAKAQDKIRAVALVGSRAGAMPRLDSDIDLVVLTADPHAFRRDVYWLDAINWQLTGVRPSTWRDADYGALWSRHVSLNDGLEVEFGFAPLSWAKWSPLDAGTKRVISGGCQILHDPDELLADLKDHLPSEKSAGQLLGAEPVLTGITIVSERLSLRSFRPADAPEIFEAASVTITRFMAWDPSPSIESFADTWRQWIPRMAAGTELHLVSRLASTDEFLGVAGLHGVGTPEPEVGIWIKEMAHGLGYGRETIAAIVKWASAHVGAKAFIYPVIEQNQPSRRLAESLHGIIVGARKLQKSNGIILDEVVYRIPAVA